MKTELKKFKKELTSTIEDSLFKKPVNDFQKGWNVAMQGVLVKMSDLSEPMTVEEINERINSAMNADTELI